MRHRPLARRIGRIAAVLFLAAMVIPPIGGAGGPLGEVQVEGPLVSNIWL
ncbi:hypothetical protein QWM81_19775 [Streptomyces ficellus]|uniref:Serine protease n=1 Tax=Streptomyces ficellus TaxID=1977088 RepID=A0ABT7Z9Z6_9ACTN|nr:hypothetical protein [Streptomyces ficellus]MDN3296260.1 hypothetical protein [Streptomyces ficellus]